MYDLKALLRGKLSDMMRAYVETKLEHPDCILFYRLGDFYEMFFDDAIEVSALLELTLTGKDCGLDEGRAPMCGVPYHAADQYIAKLVALGKKVAVCEQTENPLNKKLMTRNVVKIVTAGTVTEDETLDADSNNFIACVYCGKNKGAVAWCDITTGRFVTRKCLTTDGAASVLDALVRISPVEIICNKTFGDLASSSPLIKHSVIPKPSVTEDRNYNAAIAESLLKEQFNAATLTPYEIDGEQELISACGALVAYLRETQKHALKNVNKVELERNEEFMTLDYTAIRNLELVKNMRDGKRYGTLLWVLDKSDTPMGSRLLNEWISAPLVSVDKINYRLNGVEELFDSAVLRGGLDESLKNIRDVERLTGRVSNGNVTPADCTALAQSMNVLPALKMLLFGTKSQILRDIDDNLYDFSEIANLITKAIRSDSTEYGKNGNYINDNFDQELDRLRNLKSNANVEIKKMEERERTATGIKNLKISYNKVFGYYIEVTNSFKELVPYNYIRKQTLTGGERYVTEELKKIEEDILTSSEKIKQIEISIFEKIKSVLSDDIKRLQRTSRALACLDALVSLAKVAKRYGYVKPDVTDSDRPMNVVAGRHPVVEAISNEPFVANDIYIDNADNRLMIITGPNMAGKSTYMRQNALITVMAQTGSFVPAKSAEISVVDRIFTRVGASDNIIFNQSTFMVEMTEVAAILLHATDKSLLILDEVGRGTSTYDGLSIAWAVVEYLSKKTKAKTLFATHYHELSELEGVVDGIKNYKVTVKEVNGSIIFLRKISKGSANKSFGIEVASLAGIPKEVTDRAKAILRKLEKNDLAKNDISAQADEIEEYEEPQKLSEVEEILAQTDINSLTPLAAFKLVAELKEKVKEIE